MLPPLYAEDGEEYGAAQHAAGERYADTIDRGQERYGGGVGAGTVAVYGVPEQAYGDDGEGDGIDTVLLGHYDGGVDDRYWTLLDADGPLDYPNWESPHGGTPGEHPYRELPFDYPFRLLYQYTECGGHLEYN